MKKIFAIFFLVLTTGAYAREVPIIPRPAHAEVGDDFFELKKVVIDYPEVLDNEAQYLARGLHNAGGKVSLSGKKSKSKNLVSLSLDSGIGKAGGYILEITPVQISVRGYDNAGVFYGVVSLLQLADAQAPYLRCLKIKDSPRYQWRGFMLDEARHFFGQDKVFQILDLMAWYKLNKFHWHLSDSEGWRIEIKGYPKLTEIGSYGSWSDPDSKEAQFYTQDQIKEIIEYAAERHIEIIPEIDMPGHANASNRAYPQYSGGVDEKHGEFTFNPGKEGTYSYLTNILREVTGLFPSKYMHLGGDEVSYGINAWNTNPETQALIKREGFSSLRDAELYFINRMSDSVRHLGKRLIGWEELVEIDMDTSTTIMWWRQNRADVLEKAVDKGYEIVLCPRLPCYLDFIQDSTHKWGRIWAGEYVRLEDTYAFPDSRVPDSRGKILGVQANLWTERVPVPERLDFMMWPRLCALAEAGWSMIENKDFKKFEHRMENAYRKLDREGIYYYDHRDPARHPEVPGREKGEVKRQQPDAFFD